jgi:CRP-like cAMP-binding protein
VLNVTGLAKHALFGGLQPQELDLLRSLMKEERFPAGHDIVKEGDLGDRLYFIRAGSVAVIKACPDEPGATAQLAVLHAGDTFGEMELIDIQRRSATVRALEDVDALSLSNRDLYRISQENMHTFAMLVMNVAREISRRLRRINARMASALFVRDSEDVAGG